VKIAEVKPEELKASCSGSEDAANCLWLVTNSKPCPNCKSPIQKNEGCNHMKCSKCKFDFCWVCQESWKRHSSATGGYFRCNRFEAVQKADEKQGTMVNDAVDRNSQLQEMSKFLHFYTRYKNHENSQKLEEPLLTSVRQKMEVLASCLGFKKNKDAENVDKSTKFIEDGVRELLKARRVLCGSYVYGYYLEDDGSNKTIFEFMQNELEEVTEKLSEMVARPYLRTPKTVIVQTSALARRKRHEFVRAVAQGLIPPETPPSFRRRRRKYIDSDISQTSTWLRSCEWPEYDSDEETDIAYKSFSDESPPTEHKCGVSCTMHGGDYNLQLAIALELSRFQMVEDTKKQTKIITPPDQGSSTTNHRENNVDNQVRLAIQLSLQEETTAISKKIKSSADITVDCFLKSLANHKIDIKSLEINSDTERDFVFRPCNGKEDGRFQISDIHDKGFAFEDMDDFDDDTIRLKRSHSTGDLRVRRGRGARVRTNADEPRYHLDSDHSSQHDEKPEDVVRRLLTLPSTSVTKTKQFILLHTSYPEEESYQDVLIGQSSIEDTTTSDSIIADMEVCGILNSVTDEDLGSKAFTEDEKEVKVNSPAEETVKETQKTENLAKLNECKKQTHNPFASLKAKLCSAHLPKTGYLSRKAVNKSIGLLGDSKSKKSTEETAESSAKKFVITECKSEKHSPKKAPNQSATNCFSKSTGFLLEQERKFNKGNSSKLRIRICPSPEPKCKNHVLETDSSNEYESETGIPKSPTLFISGVSISRTPEPKSPGMSLISVSGLNSGRQSRSSSLSVPAPLSSGSLSVSTTSLTNSSSHGCHTNGHECHTTQHEPFTPSLARSTTPVTSRSNIPTPNSSPRKETKSKSASEPEREREMFRFPKSSTDGALSSVLHVQESNLSSDDFHEALFLLERSPKTRDSKRKKKSKKKDKDDKKEDVSSVL
ncbi:unnamed protein product, partial [Brassicogethes aeneus]